MTDLLTALRPEILLAVVACALFLFGTASRPLARKLAAEIALIAVVVAFLLQCFAVNRGIDHKLYNFTDATAAIHVYAFPEYVKLITAGVGILLVLLNMPTNRDGTGTNASDTGTDTAEFFALLLLSLTGLMLVASANDLILLFLGIELASIPTYIMVSISRPLPIAQEAGLKYFFLGAMSAAVMLLGFGYLYGVTGTTSLDAITLKLSGGGDSAANAALGGGPWLTLAILLLVAGFTFKMAAFPLHAYAGDVYQGAATPVTAFLSFVPKCSGFVALLKVLYATGGGAWAEPELVCKSLWAIAAITMTVGNLLALPQHNIKRTLAYSSVAQSGYMLVAVTALCYSGLKGHGQYAVQTQTDAVAGVLFYLAGYGVMTVAAFGVLQLLPSRRPRPGTSAETYDDLAGQGRKHVGLGLAMTVACLSLAGVPLTVGFLGKLYLTTPAARADCVGLSIILWVNAAISAAYYLRIVATMFLRPEPTHVPGWTSSPASPTRLVQPAPVVIAVLISVVFTLAMGGLFPVTGLLGNLAADAARLLPNIPGPAASVQVAQVSHP